MAINPGTAGRKAIRKELEDCKHQGKVITYGYLADKYGTGKEKSSMAIGEILKQEDLSQLSPLVVGESAGEIFLIKTKDIGNETSFSEQLKFLKGIGINPRPLYEAPKHLHSRLEREFNLLEERWISINDVREDCREWFQRQKKDVA